MSNSNINKLIIYKYANNKVRIYIDDNDNPWFCALDVGLHLALASYRKAVAELEKDSVSFIYAVDSLGRNRKTLFINEAGLYELIFKSNKPEAKIFKKWVFNEVIPEIRKTGKYDPKNQQKLTQNEKAVIVAKELIRVIEENDKLLKKIESDKQYTDFGKIVTDIGDCITIAQLANILSQTQYTIGQNRLFDLLRESKLIVRMVDPNHNKKLINRPSQKSIDLGYMKIRETAYSYVDSKTNEMKKCIGSQILVTGKGQLKILQIWKDKNNK